MVACWALLGEGQRHQAPSRAGSSQEENEKKIITDVQENSLERGQDGVAQEIQSKIRQ